MRTTALLFVSLALGAQARSFPRTLSKPLAVRGGAGPVDPTLACQIGTTLVSANGAMMALSPSKVGDIYGLKLEPIGEWIAENGGMTFVGTAVASWLALNGASANTAIGWGVVPQVVIGVKTLLNDLPAKFGVPAPGMILNTALNVGVVYALLTDQSYAPTVIKALLAYYGLNSLGFILATEKAAGMWGIKGSDETLLMMKSFGWFIGSFVALAYGLSEDKGATTSIGYAFVLPLISILDNLFISKSADKFGLEKNAQYFWLAIQTMIVVTTLV
jgi:hypothetical protein